jgi:1-acyl-sn-glycerol-3-phosphate acyltransferase
MTGTEPLGAADCERLRGGWIAQPTNAASSGLLALIGAWLVLRALRVEGGRGERVAAALFGVATVLAGLGSVDYHGVQTAAAQWTHDGGAAVLIAAAVCVPLWRRVRGRPSLPGVSGPVLVALAAVGVVAGSAYLAGRSGTVWCEPDSPAQLHSLWHVCIGVAAALWSVVLWPAEPAVAPGPEAGWGPHPYLRRLVRAVTSLVYRHIDTDDLSDLDDGPVLVVANHFGGLADALVLMAVLPRRPRILADDSIWEVPVVGRVMRAVGAVPVHRGNAGGTDNTSMFASTGEALRSGDLVLIFPEGITREEPSIGRIRTGAARIALGAGVTVRVVALGLHYAERSGFRTDVAVRRGSSLEVRPSPDEAPDDVDRVTAWIDAELRRCAPDYVDWDEVAALRRAAEVALEVVDPDDAVAIGERERLAAAYAALPDPVPSRIVEAVRAYESRASGRRWRPRGSKVAAALVVAAWVLALPYAAVGLAVFGIPLLVTVAATRLPLSEPMRATVVPIVAVVGCGLAAGLASVAAWQEGGWRLVGVAWALLSVSVAALVVVVERVVPWGRGALGVLRRPSRGQVEAARAELVAELGALTGVLPARPTRPTSVPPVAAGAPGSASGLPGSGSGAPGAGGTS